MSMISNRMSQGRSGPQIGAFAELSPAESRRPRSPPADPSRARRTSVGNDLHGSGPCTPWQNAGVDGDQGLADVLAAESLETTGWPGRYKNRADRLLSEASYGEARPLRTADTPRGKVTLDEFENGRYRVRIEWLGKMWFSIHKDGAEADGLFDVLLEEGGVSLRWIAFEMLDGGYGDQEDEEAQMDALYAQMEKLTLEQLEVAVTLWADDAMPYGDAIDAARLLAP